jgi:hypothetical protein
LVSDFTGTSKRTVDFTTSQSENQVQGRFLLNVVVTQGAAILKLLASEDQTLLIRRDTFLILDLGLDVVNGVRRLDLKGDGLSGKGLDEDLQMININRKQLPKKKRKNK